jgi:hypothetical protein
MWAREALLRVQRYLQQANHTLSTLDEGTSPGLRSHFLAVSSIALSFALVLASIAAGWVLLWHLAMKDINLFREVLGLNRQQSLKAKQDAAAEIMQLKRQFSRGRIPAARAT